MSTSKTRYLLLVVVCASGLATADRTPKTLRMRAGSTRVAQAAPDSPPSDPPPSDPPAGDSAPVPPPPPPPEVPAAPEQDLTDAELLKISEAQAKQEVIVVTGSTLDRRELTTTAPVTVLRRQDLEGAGITTVGDIIQKSPDQSGGINAQTNNGNTGATGVDLRGLGASRTLVLLNGRRFVRGGVGADSSVDVNSIPLAMIDRVELLKDGASAVYGSDAIGGVVNVITRDNFQGTDATLYTGGSTHDDGFTYDASFVTGHSSSKGNIVFSAGYQKHDAVWAGDRSFSQTGYTYDFTNPDPSMRQTVSGSLNTPGGRIGPKGIDYNGDGKPDGNGTLCGAPACKPDGMGGWVPFTSPGDLYNDRTLSYLYTPSQRYNVFSTGHYNLTDHTKVFFEGLYVNRQSDQQLAPDVFTSSVPISAESMYNPLHAEVFDYRRRLDEFGPRHRHQNIDTFRVVTGLAGKIPEETPVFGDWKWELSYNYGHTVAVQRREGHVILSRLANALGPSFVDSDGVPRCGTPGNVIAGCVPMNIMGPDGSIDPAARDYVGYISSPSGSNDQKTALAQTGGRLVKLPNGGDISFAAGADYRIEAGQFTPDPFTAIGDSTAPQQSATSGKYNVAEAFSELSIVPISGQPLVEWSELSLAARTFRYSTFGSGTTWKAGGLFKTAGGIAMRGTYSTAFRAPSIADLYSGQSISFPKAADPCSAPIANPTTAERCAQQGVPADAVFQTTQQQAIGGGNPNLQPETAKVLTAGLVFEPPMVKGLSLTADYFRVNIANTIASVGIQVILNDCYVRNDDKSCALIERDPFSHDISLIHDETNNIGTTTTRGVDLALAYDHKTSWGRTVTRLEGVYLLKYETDDTLTKLEGVGFYDLGVFPKLKANLSTFWQFGNASAGANVRYIGKFKECNADNCNDPMNLDMGYYRNVSASVTADVFASIAMKTRGGTTTLTVGVNNIADQKPPLIYNGFQGNSDAGTYDYMGRFIYMRLSQLF